MGRVLVTGAAGFIGSHTVEALLAKGATVLGVDNFRTGHRHSLISFESADGFQFEELDLLASDRFDSVVGSFQPDAIVHLAALVSVQESMDDPQLNFQLNVDAVHRVGLNAKQHGVRQVVFASSAAIYGDTDSLPIHEEVSKDAISPYGAAKYAGEAILKGYGRSYGFGVCCCRYFNVYGPRQDPRSPYSGVISIFADRYREQKVVTVFGDGGQTRDFIFVKDVAENNARVACAAKPVTGSFNVCTGKQTTLLEIIEVFASHYPDAPKPKFAAPRKGDILHSYGTAKLLKEALGFEAQYSVREGLDQLLASLS